MSRWSSRVTPLPTAPLLPSLTEPRGRGSNNRLAAAAPKLPSSPVQANHRVVERGRLISRSESHRAEKTPVTGAPEAQLLVRNELENFGKSRELVGHFLGC